MSSSWFVRQLDREFTAREFLQNPVQAMAGGSFLMVLRQGAAELPSACRASLWYDTPISRKES